MKRVAGALCVTEAESREVLQADLERNVRLLKQESWGTARHSVDMLDKPRLLKQESWGTARHSVDMLEKVLEDSETEEPGQEAME